MRPKRERTITVGDGLRSGYTLYRARFHHILIICRGRRCGARILRSINPRGAVAYTMEQIGRKLQIN